jgi:hypothetical protein
MQKQSSQSERVVGTILAMVLILFASLAAPKLPKSISKNLENPVLRLLIFISIGYLATKDIVTAIIAAIAVLVSYQTFSVNKITDNLMKQTNDVLNNAQSSNKISNSSTNLVNPAPQLTPELKCLNTRNLFKSTPVIMPIPQAIPKFQRPFPIS